MMTLRAVARWTPPPLSFSRCAHGALLCEKIYGTLFSQSLTRLGLVSQQSRGWNQAAGEDVTQAVVLSRWRSRCSPC